MKIVDAILLSEPHRALLRPGELVAVGENEAHVLPRFFYEVESWQQAKEAQLTTHFTLAELMTVDCREADLLLGVFPHYVPCAVAILARYLEEFRSRVEAPVCVSVNGGYRSPAHALHAVAGDLPGRLSSHSWAAAADIFRIGDTRLDSQKSIEKFARIAAGIGSEVIAKSFGSGPGETDDHLHIDLGFPHLAPRGWNEAR